MTTAACLHYHPSTKVDERWQWTLASASALLRSVRRAVRTPRTVGESDGSPPQRSPTTSSSPPPSPAPCRRASAASGDVNIPPRSNMIEHCSVSPPCASLHRSSPTTVGLPDNGCQTKKPATLLTSRMNRSATALPWRNDVQRKPSNLTCHLASQPLLSPNSSAFFATLPPQQKRIIQSLHAPIIFT